MSRQVSRKITPTDTGVSRVVQAVKAVLRYAHSRRLKEGDRLPPQQSLRVELGFSNDTLTRAMGQLMHAGIITRKSKVGTVVADLGRPLPNLWSVALPSFPAEVVGEVPFLAQLLQFLQSGVRQAGHRCHVYPMGGRGNVESPSLTDFSGLEQDILSGAVDAVLTTLATDERHWTWASRHNLPLCHTWWWETAACGVVIDQKPMVMQAASLLADQGCRRLALVAAEPPREGFSRFWEGFTEAAAGLAGRIETLPLLHEGQGVLSGQRIAQRLLSMPSGARPDGLIAVDDRVTLGLTTTLVSAGDYRPKIVVQTNRQAPLSFALPVFRFEVDIEQIATAAVNQLQQRLPNPSLPPRLEFIPPRFAGLHEHENPQGR
jgi:DNA-binding LacI/PurR family transcriptional regulator